jgi:hypothetical protein
MMADLKSQILNSNLQFVLLVAGFLLLGAVAWGVGWTAHAVIDRGPASSPTIGPTAPATATSNPVLSDGVTPLPSSTPQPPTSTPAPTVVPSPTAGYRTYVVQPGQGLAQVAGIVCPGLDSWQEREAFARRIRQWNLDKIEDVSNVSAGVELALPPCPPRARGSEAAPFPTKGSEATLGRWRVRDADPCLRLPGSGLCANCVQRV